MKYLALILLLLTSIACANPPQYPCNFEMNDGRRISWGSNVPVVLHPDFSVPASYLPALKAAAKTWNDAVGREVLVIGDYKNAPGLRDRVNTITFRFDWPGLVDQEAYTSLYFQGDRAHEADVFFNLHYLLSVTDIPIPGQIDLQSLALHEFGHVLGLDHIPIEGDVMFKALRTGTLRRVLSAVDKRSIECEY